jgi:sec-independent protein translocase protein TatB
MMDLSWSHILIVLMVALVVVGPKDLPRLMRMTGRWIAKARGMADQFRKSFDDMARQSELDELRAELESLRHERPLAEVDRALRAPALGSDPTADSGPSSSLQTNKDSSVEPIGDTVANGLGE